ncbi:MAG: ankyrin repeat domain-containing protein [Bryobacteraceae bacterium]
MKWCGTALLSASSLLAAGPDARLADAAKNMDRPAIRALLEQQHVDVNARQLDGTSALDWAAEQDDLETARLLVKAGADVKAANRYGVTALSLACTNGNAAIVELLLNAGADANTILPGGETALMTAARTGKVNAVKVLLEHGADVNATESVFGQTALMWAAAEGNTAAVEALLKGGANLHASTKSGFTPLLFAAREGRIGVVKALLQAGADVNETVHSSAKKAGGVQGPPADGTSAMLLAVSNCHFELASVMLDAGADPNAALPGWTALHTISWVRKPGLGDNDPAPQGSGNMSSLELVKKLVEHGANINAQMTRKVNVGLTSLNTLGATPFLLAARSADAQLMRALAALGADPKITTADKANAMIVAAGLGTRSPGEDAGSDSEVVEALQAALDLGVDINAVDNNGETAMHGAAYKNAPGAVQFLADHGAKMEIWNRKNSHGWTPLWIADGHRFGNFKPSPDTIAVFRRLMTAAGASIAPMPDPSIKNSDYR